MVVRVRKKFWLGAILTSLCLIVLNLLSSISEHGLLLSEDNSVFLSDEADLDGFLGDRAIDNFSDLAPGLRIVGLDDLPAIRPLGCVRTKPILEGANPIMTMVFLQSNDKVKIPTRIILSYQNLHGKLTFLVWISEPIT